MFYEGGFDYIMMMVMMYYIFGLISILSTVCMIIHYNPIRALLYLIISFLSVSCCFFVLGASFAGAVEIIVYAGAIMVLFALVVMMLNTNTVLLHSMKEYRFLDFNICCGVILLASILLFILLYVIFGIEDNYINLSISSAITLKAIGIKLFSDYALIVEIASFLLLSALVIGMHFGQSGSSTLIIKSVSNVSVSKEKEYEI